MTAPDVELRPELLALARELRALPLTLVAAPAGSGKTTLLGAWRAALAGDGAVTAWLALGPLHADAALFLEDLAARVHAALGAGADEERFAAGLLRRLPHLADQEPERLAAWLARELRDLREPLHLFLDGYEQLPRAGPVDRIVSALARDASLELRLVIASRGLRPAATARLLAEDRARVLGAEDLSLRADQVARVLLESDASADPEIVVRLLAETRGWAAGVRVAAAALAGRSREEALARIAALPRQPDVFAYFAAEVLTGAPAPLARLLEDAAFLGPVPRALLEADSGGAARVDGALDRGLLQAEGDTLSLHPLWAQLLRERVAARLAPGELGRRGAGWVARLAAAGRPEQALEVAAELGLVEAAAGLLEEHGLGWLERGGHESVSRWLAAAGPQAAARPKLALLDALLLARRDLDAGLDALETVADRFRAAGDGDGEIDVLHNAVILAGNAHRVERVRRLVRRIVGLRRLATSRRARTAAAGFAGMAAFVAGRYRLARRLSDRVARLELAPRERAGLALGRVRLAMLAGEWEAGSALLDEALADPDLRGHAPAFYTLEGFRGQLDGLLGRDLETALARLEDAREACASFQLGVTEVLLDLGLAPLLARAERGEDALAALDRAERRAAELGHGEGRVAAEALRARLHLDFGRRAAAGAAAARALEHVDATVLRRAPWYPALAAAALADAGEPARARDFARARRRALDCPGLPMMQHALHVALARVAAAAGDAAARGRHLERAWRAAGEADLRHASPELGPALLAWGVEQAPAQAATAVARLCARSEAAPWLRIDSLGGVEVRHHGRPVGAAGWRGVTTRRLLVRLLVARGRPLVRARLEEELWPDLAPADARNNLRVALSRLRRVLEPDRRPGEPERCLRIEGDRVALAEPCLAAWDALRFERLLAEARAGAAATLGERMHAALGEYRGAFAPEVHDEWAEGLRAALENSLREAGQRAARALLEAGDPRAARALAARLVDVIPCDEEAWRLLVEAGLAAGDRSGALRDLVRAEAALARELGLEAGPALRALAEQARAAAASRAGGG